MIPRNCNFCGLCCTLTVKVAESEINQIERLGHSREGFVEKDEGGNLVLKKKDGWCVFLELEKGVGRCKVYGSRPSPCRNFPGKALCDLRDGVVFRLWKNVPPKVKLLLEKAPKKNDPLPEEEPRFPES